MSSAGDDRRSWRRAADDRLRRAYAVVEQGFAELDRTSGRRPAPWRQRADEVLDDVYAELERGRACRETS